MRAVKQWVSLFLVAAFVGGCLPDGASALYIAGVVLLFSLLLVNAKISCNLPLYIKGLVLLAGSLCGMFGAAAVKNLRMEQVAWLMSGLFHYRAVIVSLLVCLVLFPLIKYAEYREENNRRVADWHIRNLFLEREDDLKRLLGYVRDPKVTTIGLEAEWGQGKSYLLEGLVAALQVESGKPDNIPYEIVKIDVLAVRLDSFAEYLVQEVNNVLFTNGRVSSNMRKLQGVFKAAKVNLLKSIWEGGDKRYAKIFADFRKELLRLRKNVLIIYEDLDRLQNADAVRNILYLTEKLTAANDTVWRGGIKAIYQYDRRHMKDMGFTEQFLEKYMRCHMDLSPISLKTMIQQMQQDTKAAYKLTSQEIWELPMGSTYVSQPIWEDESVWVERYLAKSITIRRTEDFIKTVERSLGWFHNIQPWERDTIIAFSYIEYFLPLAYARLKEAAVCDLQQVFSIYDKGTEVQLVQMAQAYRKLEMEFMMTRNDAEQREYLEQRLAVVRAKLKRQVDYRNEDYENAPERFELYLALRLLKLDQIKLPE